MTTEYMFDEKYVYYAYPITEELFKNNAILFREGLPIKVKNLGLKNKIAYNDQELQDYLDYIAAPNSNNEKIIAIIKIPLYYLGYQINIGSITPYIPLIKTYFDYVNGETNYIIPELILGLYNAETKEYRENHDHNYFFNPNGLQFTDNQIKMMATYGPPSLVTYAKNRRTIPYQVLAYQDNLSHAFDESKAYYQQQLFKKKAKTLIIK